MIEIVNKFEKAIYAGLIILLMVVLVFAMVDLVYRTGVTLYETPWVLEAHEMIVLLGAFLLVLIGVELLDTIKAYFTENTIHVEIVVLLAIIAVARKVILLDPTGMNPVDYSTELIGIGIIVVGLASGYYLIKKAGFTPDSGVKEKQERSD
jgi:uncharacterized membrane protein (DUF373 family)